MVRTNFGNSTAHWYIFLLSPFLAGIIAFKNREAKWAKNILWLFVVFYGFTFSYAEEVASGGGTTDIYRYIDDIKVMYQQNLDLNQIAQLYKENHDVDILRLTLTIVVSRFTDSARVLTAIYALIFGFFFSRNIWFVLDRLKGKIRPFTILLIITFFLINPFWNINGFRFWTATHIYIYGVLLFLFEGQKKGLLISSLSVLVHFSFVVPLTVLLVYIVFGKRTIIYFIFFLVSIVASEINIGRLNSIIDANAPKALSDRSANYRKEDRVKEFRSGTGFGTSATESWHAKFYQKGLNWALMAFLIFLFYKRKILEQMNSRFTKALAFALLFWAVSNFMSSLPSGVRFLIIASMSVLPLIIFYVHYKQKDKLLVKLNYLAIPAFVLFIIVSIRMGFYSLSVNTLVGNPIVAIFTDYNFALNDFIK
jgi:hypothetical protein